MNPSVQSSFHLFYQGGGTGDEEDTSEEEGVVPQVGLTSK